METLEDIEAQLKSHKNSMGTSLFDHISNVVNTMKNNPNKTMEDPFKYFETISHFIAQNQFDYKTPMSEQEVEELQPQQAELNQWMQQENSLICSRDSDAFTQQKHNVPDTQKVLNMLEWAGLGFGKEENYRLTLSLNQLQRQQQKQGCQLLRFWGKIQCIQNDLYVAEGYVDKKFSDELPPNWEPRGQGVNTMTYWVTHDLLSDWVELPLIGPKHIQQSRRLKQLLTGDLERVMDVYPEFEGKEKHLLKAQIVRITHSTVLDFVEKWKLKEDNDNLIELNEDNLQENGQFNQPNWEMIRSMESWVHLFPNILSTGRCSHYRPKGMDEETFEALKGEQLEPAEQKVFNDIGRLLPIANEARVYPHNKEKDADDEENQNQAEIKFQSNWLQKVCGNNQKYIKGEEEGETSYATMVLKNLWWPGSNFVAQDGLYANVYIGNCLKDQNPSEYPNNDKFEPEDLFDEPQDQDNHYEPVPKNEPQAKVEEVEGEEED